jgi:hypothetical protein
MKIIAFKSNPSTLKKAIDKKMSTPVALKTWEIKKNDKDEVLYSHIPEQWKEKAMLKPKILNDRIEFEINWWSKNGEPDEATKGYITGRFVEILMVHFKNKFTKLEIK